MATDEEKQLMARIGQVAAQINRHKNQSSGATSSQHRYNPYPHPRGGRGGRRGSFHPPRSSAPHRHRTLVLNGSGGQPQQQSGPADDSSSSDTQTTWVSKNDRHLQLINSNVYEKDSQARAKAIAETQQQKMQKRDDHEKTKLQAFFRGAPASVSAARRFNDSGQYELNIEGIRFLVTKDGSKLVKAPGDINPPSATPKVAVVGGVKFFRSKSGNLYRDGIVKAHRKTGRVKKVDEPCKAFSTTGSCPKGPQCRYIHDPVKVAICKEFLQKGTCTNGEHCDLSHDPTPERTPACLHYAKGNCSNPQCRYAHSDVSPGAPVCRRFGLYGYCDRGSQCPERHVFECPDFSNTGRCKTKGCKLVHRERASVLRRAGQRESEGSGGGGDISSDSDSVASDDVDSDEVEELFGDDDVDHSAFQEQKDYISF